MRWCVLLSTPLFFSASGHDSFESHVISEPQAPRQHGRRHSRHSRPDAVAADKNSDHLRHKSPMSPETQHMLRRHARNGSTNRALHHPTSTATVRSGSGPLMRRESDQPNIPTHEAKKPEIRSILHEPKHYPRELHTISHKPSLSTHVHLGTDVPYEDSDLLEEEADELHEDERHMDSSSLKGRHGRWWDTRRRGTSGLLGPIYGPIISSLAKGFQSVATGLIPKDLAMKSITSKSVKLTHLSLPHVAATDIAMKKVRADHVEIPAMQLGTKGKRFVTFTGLKADRLHLNDINAKDTKISNVAITGMMLKNTNINDLKGNKMSLKGLDVEGKASLDRVKMHDLSLNGKITLDSANLQNVDISGTANLNSVGISGADITGSAAFGDMALGQINIDDIEFGPFGSVVAVLSLYSAMITYGLFLLICMCCMVGVYTSVTLMRASGK